MADLYYIEEGYYDQGYFVYTADAAAAFTAAATASCTAGLVKSTEITASSESSSSITAQNLRGTDIGLSSSLSISATAGAVKSTEVDCGSLFSPTVTAQVNKGTDIDLSSSASMSATVSRERSSDVTLTTIMNLSAQGLRVKSADSAFSSEFTQSTEVDKIKGLSAALAATATSSTTATEYSSYIATSPTPLYARGQALISSSVTHFGTHSLYLPDAAAGAISASLQSKFHISGSDDFSIALWYYPTANGVGSFDDIISWFDATNGWALQRSGNRGLRFLITNGSTTEVTSTGTTILTLNAWNWIVVTRTGTTLEIYVNGTQRAFDFTHSQGTASGAKSFRIGNITGNGSAVGYLDGVHITIGSTISTATPAVDTEFATADTKLLLNWNDSAFGNWWDSSLNDLQSADTSLTCQTSLSATLTSPTTNGAADLSAPAGLSAEVLRIKSLSADLLVEGFILTEGTALINEAHLTSAFAVSATIDDPYLQLIYGTANTSGYITSTGLTAITKNFVADGQAPDYYDRRPATPAEINFWIKIDGTMTSGQVLKVYQSSSGHHTITLENISGTYYVRITWPSLFCWVNLGYDATYYRYTLASPGVLIPLPSAPTTFTNIHGYFVPGFSQRYFTDTNLLTNYLTIDRGTYYVNGSAVATTSTGGAWLDSGISGSYNPPGFVTTSATLADGGQWGEATNAKDLYIDDVWVNKLAVDDDNVTETLTPVSDFISGGVRQAIFQGLTSSAVQGEVWLPWRSLLDKASPSPTWDYTAFNHVLYGYIKTAESFTSAATALDIDYTRIRPADASTLAEFTQTTTAVRNIGPIISNQTANTTLSATIKRFRSTDITVNSVITVDATAMKAIVASSDVSVLTTMSVDAKKYASTPADLNGEFAVDAVAIKTVAADIDTTAIASELTIAVKTGRTLVTIETQATLTCAAVKSVEASTTLSSAASQSTDFLKLPQPREYASAMAATATMTVAVKKYLGTSADLSATATMSPIPGVYWWGQSDMSTEFTQNAVAVAGKLAIINASSQFTQTATTLNSRIRGADSTMSALDFLFAIGTKLKVDPYYQLKVPRELRVKKITQETAVLTVDSEKRLYTVRAETMTVVAESETRILNIPFAPQVGARRVK